MPRKEKHPARPARPGQEAEHAPRIIGGSLRGRRLLYSGDARTRPMKDRVREAVFNLIGPAVQGKHVIDLFAGTGALGLEALSRGAARATLVEQHFPTANIIRQNIAQLGLAGQAEVAAANAFLWPRRAELPAIPWLVFCSPPYDFYVHRRDDMLTLLNQLLSQAPAESVFVVEADARFDFQSLPHAHPDAWQIREYPPAVIGICRLPL